MDQKDIMKNFFRGQTPSTNANNAGTQMQELAAIQNITNKQKRTRGYVFNCAIGTNSFDIAISGTARVLLGFSLMNNLNEQTNIVGDGFSLFVNNEQIVENVNPNFFNGFFKIEEFTYFPRPLNGSDKVTVRVDTAAVSNISMTIYYI
jgi:hypothetical protein